MSNPEASVSKPTLMLFWIYLIFEP